MNKYMYILFMLVTSFSCLDKDQELEEVIQSL